MIRRTKTRLIFSGVFVVGIFILNWLIVGESSPLSEYFLWNVEIPNTWASLNIIPGIMAVIAAGNPHAGGEGVYWVAFTLHWFGIGYLLSALLPSGKKLKTEF
ncbi:MAG TPA: hypothetical protein VF766_08335 [Pyrinomonadaceae bacterium]